MINSASKAVRGLRAVATVAAASRNSVKPKKSVQLLAAARATGAEKVSTLRCARCVAAVASERCNDASTGCSAPGRAETARICANLRKSRPQAALAAQLSAERCNCSECVV